MMGGSCGGNLVEAEESGEEGNRGNGNGMALTMTIQRGIPQIPIDLFVRIKGKRVVFTDAFRNVVFTSGSAAGAVGVLHDPDGRPLISVLRSPLEGQWKGVKGEQEPRLLFTVDRILNTFSKVELNVFRGVSSSAEAAAGAEASPTPSSASASPNMLLSFAIRGCVFWRSCTIYHHPSYSILAQTNLMYKLGFRKHFVGRNKFRVTVFPGFTDHDLIAALILVFLDARSSR